MIFCENVNKPEGPVSLSDGSWLIAEMKYGVISHIGSDGQKKRIIAETGRPNGLAVDGDGCIWVAESKFPAILKLTMAGECVFISKGNPELPFLWPNDICLSPEGEIFITDSGIHHNDLMAADSPEAVYDMPIDGRVFRIDPISGNCVLVDSGLSFANGIAFGPGGEYLYVNETLTGDIYRYRIVDGRVKGDRDHFSNVLVRSARDFNSLAGPDGMAFDSNGNLYVGVLQQGDITVIAPDGGIANRISINGKLPTNVAFSRTDTPRILVTEGSNNQLVMIDVPVEGLPLYYPKYI